MNEESKKKKWIYKTGFIFFLLGGATVGNQPILAFAETSQEIAQEKQKVDEKVFQLQEEIKKAEATMNQMKQNFETSEKEITEVNQKISETQDRIDKRMELLGNRLAAVQQNETGLGTYVQVILGADSFSNLISRVVAISQIVDADQNLIKEQTKDQKLLEKQKKDLEQKKKDLEEQFKAMQEQHEKMGIQMAEQEALSLELGNKLEDAKAAEERVTRLAFLQNQSFERFTIDSASFLNDANVSEKAFQIIDEASKYLGMPYTWGGANPSTSFDCSGLTQWSFSQAGIQLPRTAAQQFIATQRVSVTDVKPGDLVFFSYGKGIAHVGIYIGGGKMLQSSNTGVNISKLDGYWGQYIAGFGRVDGVN